jgi:DNA modification methylase
VIVEMRPVDSVRPYPGNPRRNDHAVEVVAKSVREFGFRQPIVVDADGVIVVGHTRYKAALKLGLSEVPAHVALDLTPAQAKAYRLADNRTASIAEWDDDKLVAELLALRDVGVDLDLLGFPADELTEMLGGGVTLEGDPDDTPELPADPVTRPGDLWRLGKHRLVCGDAADPAAYAKLLEGTQADLLLTDPPYGVSYVGGTADAMTLANDDLAPEDYDPFLAKTLGAAAACLKPGAAFYVWHADVHGATVRRAAERAGLPLRQVLVWVKSAFAMGRADYHWQHEPCLYGWRPGAPHQWHGGRAQGTTLCFDRPARNGEHPTMKPVALFQRLVENSCPAGGVVLDPFAGSGTTLVAAHACGRRAALLEVDPRYCDVVVKRFEALTGLTATREAGPAGAAAAA